MSKLKAAFIGFMPQNATLEEQFRILKSYADLGYAATEVGDFLLQGDVKENLKRMQEIGMYTLATTFPDDLGDMDAAVAKTVEKAEALGVRWATTYGSVCADFRFGGRDTRPGYSEFMREVETRNEFAKRLAKEGIVASFHNHDAEFQTLYNGKPAFYHMLENSEYLKFEVDLGWVLYGHYDPLQVLDDVADKLHEIHVKDFTYGNSINPPAPGTSFDPEKFQNGMPNFTTPGTGFLPLEKCLKKAASYGATHAIIEQDYPRNVDNYAILAGAIRNMREAGVIE